MQCYKEAVEQQVAAHQVCNRCVLDLTQSCDKFIQLISATAFSQRRRCEPRRRDLSPLARKHIPTDYGKGTWTSSLKSAEKIDQCAL